MDEATFHPLDYVSVVRRRLLWLITPVVLALVVGVALVLFLPKEYLASATIGIAAPAIAPDLARSAVPLDREERVRAVSQQLLDRSVLARVAQAEHLGDGAAVDATVARLRSAIQVSVPEPLAPSEGAPPLDTFIVSYADPSAERSQRVTNRIAQVFVDDNSRTRAARAQDTSEFIDAELRQSKNRLDALEAKLRDAKERNMGRLPEQTAANLQMVAGLRQQLDSTVNALRSEQDRLSMIERQIQAAQQGNAAGRGGAADANTLTGQARVLALENQLEQARAMYTEKHPEIQRLKDELANARAQEAAESKRPASDRLAMLQSDPLYRQLVGDREASRLRIRDLEREQNQAQRQIAVYQARVDAAPIAEQQLSGLQRDYDLERAQYADLSGKYRAALLSENLEQKRGSEHFKVITPALLPREPFKPNRLRIFLMCTVAGLFLGVGLTAGREFLDRSVHDARSLAREFDVPVLAEIPRIERVA